MQTENLIAISDFCSKHNIEISFINSIQKSGMIEFTIVEESLFIDTDHLQELEKIVYFHYELDINLEGIETINHLLQQINYLQEDIVALKNRLALYEK